MTYTAVFSERKDYFFVLKMSSLNSSFVPLATVFLNVFLYSMYVFMYCMSSRSVSYDGQQSEVKCWLVSSTVRSEV